MIKVVTDSTCDLPEELVKRHNIHIIPLSIHFGTQTYKDGLTITAEELYQKIALDGLIPTTSQPSVGEVVEFYRQVAGEADTIISLHLSSKLSGTYQSVQMARAMLPERDIHVFDTYSVSGGVGYMALEAARAAEAGQTAQEILRRLEVVKERMNLVLTPDTLKYLVASGRTTRLQSMAASLLNVKVIIVMKEGGLEAVEKVRTRKRSLQRLVEMTQERVGDAPVNLGVVHARAPQEGQEVLEEARRQLNLRESFIEDLTTTLVVHAGPGVVGLVSYMV